MVWGSCPKASPRGCKGVNMGVEGLWGTYLHKGVNMDSEVFTTELGGGGGGGIW